MRTLAMLVVLALACGVAGCGKSDPADNSAIQTPDNQPIGMPKSVGGKTETMKELPKGGAGRGNAKQPPPVKINK